MFIKNLSNLVAMVKKKTIEDHVNQCNVILKPEMKKKSGIKYYLKKNTLTN